MQLKPVIPAYPEAALSRGQEGFVTLNFIVEPDGSVADPIVEDSSGIKEFEKAAITSILKTRYRPATLDGKPIQQCATQQVYHFTIDRRGLGARSAFVSDYKQVAKLVGEQQEATAEAKLDEMVKKGAWNNYESARLWLLRAKFQDAHGDELGALRSYRRAMVDNGMYLESNLYREVLREVLRREIKTTEYAEALSTYAKMMRLKPPLQDEAITHAVAQIRQAIDGPDVLAFAGTVEFRTGCDEGASNWQHTLLRRKFAFGETQGQVDNFQLRCDWKRVIDKVSTDKAWEVPKSWGHCEVFVFGELGAQVKLLEYPTAVQAATSPKAAAN